MSNFENTQNFAKGNVAEENKNFKLIAIRVPAYVHDELRTIAFNNRVAIGRVAIEILRSVADKRIASRGAGTDAVGSVDGDE